MPQYTTTLESITKKIYIRHIRQIRYIDKIYKKKYVGHIYLLCLSKKGKNAEKILLRVIENFPRKEEITWFFVVVLVCGSILISNLLR